MSMDPYQTPRVLTVELVVELGRRADELLAASPYASTYRTAGAWFTAPTTPKPGAHPELDPEAFGDFVFDTADISSKWGFGDGDMLNEFCDEWEASRGWVGSEHTTSYPYISRGAALEAVWYCFLAPALGSDAPRICRISTAHNPICVDDDGVGDDDVDSVIVVVPGEELAVLFDEVFPPRSEGWLHVYSTVCHLNDLDREARAVADLLDPALPGWVLRLAAELWRNDAAISWESALRCAFLVGN